MTHFSYTARNKDGEIQRGTLEAKDRETAAETLNGRDLSPISILEQKGTLAYLNKIKNFTLIPAVEKVIFSRQLATLLNAGVPLVQSLNILKKQTTNKRMEEIVSDISKEVEGGSSLSKAMEKHEKIFGSIFVNMVAAGEIGGILDQTMEKMADQIEKDHEISAKIRGAMMYPLIIVIAMVGAVIFMMVSIIPELGKMFADMNAELPTSTKILIAISKALTEYGFFTFIGFASFVLGIRFLIKKSYLVRKKIHFILLHVPVLGMAIRKINVVRFSRTLGALLESGIAIVETLDIISKATPNLIFKEELLKMKEKVEGGTPLAVTMEGSKNFPLLVSQMISVGEESGSLSEILMKISDFYEKEVDNIIKNLTSLLEPVLMILIGSMIGFMMISIIKPIYQLTNMF